MNKTLSLKDAIRAAATPQEVNDLLVVGSAYQFVSEKTKRKWEREAAKKINSFK